MRISDWSSDVCSSDLAVCIIVSLMARLYDGKWVPDSQAVLQNLTMVHIFTIERLATSPGSRRDDACILKRQFMTFSDQSGDRKSVVSGRSGSVSVDLGGRGIIKKKKKIHKKYI